MRVAFASLRGEIDLELREGGANLSYPEAARKWVSREETLPLTQCYLTFTGP